MQSDETEVTQADRDAAADMYRRFCYGATVDVQAKIRRDIERGANDSDPLVQVFARHRLTTPSSPAQSGWNQTQYGHPIPGLHVWCWHRLWERGVTLGYWHSEGDCWHLIDDDNSWFGPGLEPTHWTRDWLKGRPTPPSPAQGEREGWVMVPREPTEAMKEAATEIGIDALNGRWTALNWEEAAAVWSAMLAALDTADNGAADVLVVGNAPVPVPQSEAGGVSGRRARAVLQEAWDAEDLPDLRFGYEDAGRIVGHILAALRPSTLAGGLPGGGEACENDVNLPEKSG